MFKRIGKNLIIMSTLILQFSTFSHAVPKNFDYSGLDSSDSETVTVSKKAWTEEEDELLRSAVEDSGKRTNWIIVASKVPNHGVRSCRERYVLKFKAKKVWTQEDDERLISLIDSYGTQWKTIARNFKKHSVLECKNRYYFMKRTNKVVTFVPMKMVEHSDGADDNVKDSEEMIFYDEKESWSWTLDDFDM